LKIVEPKEKDGKLVEVKVEETRYIESDTALHRRLIGRDVGGKQNILVLNDEAHHAHRIAQAHPDEDLDAEALDEESVEEFAQEGTVWVDGRRARSCVALTGGS
jgi:type III restriction enzyme